MSSSRCQNEEQEKESRLLEALAIKLLGEGYAVDLVVTGSSMAPLLRSGDVLTLSPIQGESVALGDVVAYARGDGHLVVHRAVSTGRSAVLMQGDSVPTADGWIAHRRILGRVRRSLRDGRRRRLGLGPERALVAWMVRAGALQRLMAGVRLLRGSAHSRSVRRSTASSSGRKRSS